MRRITVSTLILLVCLTSWHTTSQPTFASSTTQTTPPTYAHSWYITDPSDSGMQHLGQKDATWTNQHCGSGLVVLAFGQPTYANGSYGVYDHGPGSPFVSNAQVISAAEQYMMAWYNNAKSCLRLTLIIGLNNFDECVYGPPCDVYTAGQQWADVVSILASWLKSQHYAWQINVWGGDDMETSWDQPATTRAFVDGYNDNDATNSPFVDFGMADQVNSSTWTDADIYYVAGGARHDVPLPEIYDTSGYSANRWTQIRKEYHLSFFGVMTECAGNDPLPITNCYQDMNKDYENAPNQAWSLFWNTLNENGVGPPSLNYVTNIQFQ